jgi:hypothetical protein
MENGWLKSVAMMGTVLAAAGALEKLSGNGPDRTEKTGNLVIKIMESAMVLAGTARRPGPRRRVSRAAGSGRPSRSRRPTSIETVPDLPPGKLPPRARRVRSKTWPGRGAGIGPGNLTA